MEPARRHPWNPIVRFLDRGIWVMDLATLGGLRRAGILALRVAVLAARGVAHHQLWLRAAALTYVTVFSLVPMLAVGFAMFKAFGGLEDATEVLLPRLLDYLSVGTRDAVEGRILEFLANVHGGAIGTFGGLLLGFSAISLLTTVERAFNAIWGIEEHRNLSRRVTTYWTLATVTPSLLVVGMTLPRAIQRAPTISWLLEHTATAALLVSVLLPLVFVAGGLALLYAVMPNTRVTARAALVGGVTGGSLFAVAAWGYAMYAARAVNYSTIYGSLGAVPLFLLWVNVAWLLVLIGAEVARAVERAGAYADETVAADASQTARQVLTLRVLCEVTRAFNTGRPLTTADAVRSLGSPAGLVGAIVAELVRAELLYRTAEDGRLVPAREPRELHPADALRALRDRGRTDELLGRDEETRLLLTRVEESDRTARQAWREPSIAALALAATA
jgi:membrane protein